MTRENLKYFDILSAKRTFAEGGNITELLRSQKNMSKNTPEIIEIAYDLQAGTYIEQVKSNPRQASLYSGELAQILAKHVVQTDSLLDIGTGELTTLSLLVQAIEIKPKDIYALDISWSRLFKGLGYAEENMGSAYDSLTAFVGDIREIPLLDKSIDITTSSHALEPNGGNLKELMAELFRVTIKKLVLFEPCFEINSEEGKRRMEALGYIKNVEGIIDELGGKLIERITIKNTANPLNPTVCYVVIPPLAPTAEIQSARARDSIFSVPGTNYRLEKIDDFYFSHVTGLCYPVLKTIPILKSCSAILASSLCN
ncbi:MAG TPA: class I SAM-dependent methyltransferase [Candidimonas sp.]|nr:class I SAM-dependent methyltransferase [Candidimonas sp.]